MVFIWVKFIFISVLELQFYLFNWDVLYWLSDYQIKVELDISPSNGVLCVSGQLQRCII